MGKRSQKNSVLMVCVGNLCRSPIAEAVMRDVVARAGLQAEWHVESAGIEGWHSGRRPDERALNVLARHNLDYFGTARVLAPEDYLKFDYIFGMDLSNLAALRRMAPKGATAKLLLLGDFGLRPDERILEDPYYDIGEAPFEQIYRQCKIACKNFLKQARLKQIISPIAEVVMVDTLEKANVKDVEVDSAAIGGWHVGNRADPRAISTLQKHGLKCTHIVRQIRKQDFSEFDYIFGMDEDNMSELRRLAPKDSKAELLMLGDFGLEKKNRIIEDPYYERGAEGFETAYQQCVVACAAFMKERLQK